MRLAPIAALLLLAGPALAQTGGSAAPASQLEAVGLSPPTVMSEGHRLAAEEVMVSAVIGHAVHSGVDTAAPAVGSVRDLVIGPLGDITAAIIEITAFPGVPPKTVAVDYMDLLRVPAPDGQMRWALETSAEALLAAPEFVAAAPAAQPVLTDPSLATPEAAPVTAEPVAPRGAESGPIPPAMDLRGLGLYGRNDQPIGTVNTVLETASGEIDALIIDVGGFLGLGAQPVAVAFESVTLATDTAGASYLHIDATRQEFENHPVYDPGTYAQERDFQRFVGR